MQRPDTTAHVGGDCELFTVVEAANLLKLNRATRYRGIRSGVVPAVRLGPHGLRVQRAARDQLVERAIATADREGCQT